MPATIPQDFETRQEVRFAALENTLERGFREVTDEIRKLREEGTMPTGVLQSLLSHNYEQFAKVQKLQAWLIAAVLIYVTGIKFAPDIITGFMNK